MTAIEFELLDFIILIKDFKPACSTPLKLGNDIIRVKLRDFGAQPPTPTHVKIYKVCVYVTV